MTESRRAFRELLELLGQIDAQYVGEPGEYKSALDIADGLGDLHDIEALIDIGYTHEQAASMAGKRIDVTDVRKLLAAGCSREIAARVAWPLP